MRQEPFVVAKNVFERGLNADTTKDFLRGDQYCAAHNLVLSEKNGFFALQNSVATEHLHTITNNASVRVLGAFEVRCLVGTTQVRGLVIFTAVPGGDWKIWFYSPSPSTLYELYTEPTPSDYFQESKVVQAVLLTENNVDTLYFTDNYFEPRKLRCEIPMPYVPNFLTEFDLSLLRKGAIGRLLIANVISNAGSLLTGSYQFAYQLVDPVRKKTTKFSLLTNPVNIYTTINDKTCAGYGLGSSKAVILQITPSTEELANFTHFRLAVVEHVYPEGQATTHASLTQTFKISDYVSGGNIVFTFKHNLQNNLLPISELTIDDAPIKCARTIAIKNNRLFLGGITYKDLKYDHPDGGPVVDVGSKIDINNTINPTWDLLSSRRGYMRDEVYRFAIVYFDKDGNFSEPYPLDMSNVEFNKSTQTGFKDLKFPRRGHVESNGTRYSLLTGINTRNLFVSLIIKNHPTWARGFVIVRRKRLKNILWQSPLIPAREVYAIGPVDRYPTTYCVQNPFQVVTLESATPMGPATVYLPMELHWPKLRHIRQVKQKTGSGSSTRLVGEARIVVDGFHGLSFVYPPPTMYSQFSKYNFLPSHKLQTVDAVQLQNQNVSVDFTENPVAPSAARGNTVYTSVGSTFYAIRDVFYYYSASHSASLPLLRSSLLIMSGFKEFDNYSPGALVEGKYVYTYDKFITGGVSFGGTQIPNVQRSCVITHPTILAINHDNSLTFASGITPRTAVADDNVFALSGTPGSLVINCLEIVNCVAGLDDHRYGDPNAPQEFISTGAVVVFSDAELATVRAGGSLPKSVDVYGGDCYVSSHTFKISDSSVSIINPNKFINIQTGVNLWEKAYNIVNTQSVISMPVVLKNATSFVQVYLESEYNGDVVDINNLEKNTTVVSLNGVNWQKDESELRTSLSYSYNHNISRENDLKVFALLDPEIPRNTKFNSRIVFSDVKVYQTEIEGFDTFRVLNVYDLQETNGPLYKLILAGDALIAIQQQAVHYLGVGERQVETRDGSTLVVGTGDVIGDVRTVSTQYGTQHPASVVSDGSSVYFFDNLNQAVLQLSGVGLEVLSLAGVWSILRQHLNTIVPEADIVGVYDAIRREYWVADISGSLCLVYNINKGLWVSNYEFANKGLLAAARINQVLYVIGLLPTNDLSISKMYSGVPGQIMGVYRVPRVTFVVNDALETPKTFDNLSIIATGRLDTADVEVERETLLGNQLISGINLNVTSRGQNMYVVPIPYDVNRSRARGTRALVTLKWVSGASASPVSVTTVLTKYRQSESVF